MADEQLSEVGELTSINREEVPEALAVQARRQALMFHIRAKRPELFTPQGGVKDPELMTAFFQDPEQLTAVFGDVKAPARLPEEDLFIEQGLLRARKIRQEAAKDLAVTAAQAALIPAGGLLGRAAVQGTLGTVAPTVSRLAAPAIQKLTQSPVAQAAGRAVTTVLPTRASIPSIAVGSIPTAELAAESIGAALGANIPKAVAGDQDAIQFATNVAYDTAVDGIIAGGTQFGGFLAKYIPFISRPRQTAEGFRLGRVSPVQVAKEHLEEVNRALDPRFLTKSKFQEPVKDFRLSNNAVDFEEALETTLNPILFAAARANKAERNIFKKDLKNGVLQPFLAQRDRIGRMIDDVGDQLEQVAKDRGKLDKLVVPLNDYVAQFKRTTNDAGQALNTKAADTVYASTRDDIASRYLTGEDLFDYNKVNAAFKDRGVDVFTMDTTELRQVFSRALRLKGEGVSAKAIEKKLRLIDTADRLKAQLNGKYVTLSDRLNDKRALGRSAKFNDKGTEADALQRADVFRELEATSRQGIEADIAAVLPDQIQAYQNMNEEYRKFVRLTPRVRAIAALEGIERPLAGDLGAKGVGTVERGGVGIRSFLSGASPRVLTTTEQIKIAQELFDNPAVVERMKLLPRMGATALGKLQANVENIFSPMTAQLIRSARETPGLAFSDAAAEGLDLIEDTINEMIDSADNVRMSAALQLKRNFPGIVEDHFLTKNDPRFKGIDIITDRNGVAKVVDTQQQQQVIDLIKNDSELSVGEKALFLSEFTSNTGSLAGYGKRLTPQPSRTTPVKRVNTKRTRMKLVKDGKVKDVRDYGKTDALIERAAK